MGIWEVVPWAMPPGVRAKRDANLFIKYLVEGNLTVYQNKLIVETAPDPYLHQLPRDLPPELLEHREPEVRRCQQALVAEEEQGRGDEEGTGPGPAPVVVLRGGLGIDVNDTAVHLGHRLEEELPDFQLCLDLGRPGPAGAGQRASRVTTGPDPEAAPPRIEPVDALATLIRSFGTRDSVIPDTLEERAAMFRSLVDGKRGLLVLQNVADRASLRWLLPGSSTCAVVVTSDREFPELEGAMQVQLEPVPDGQARDMLAYLIGQDRVARDGAAVTAILDWTGLQPLAIRQAGALLRGPRFRDLPLERAAAELAGGRASGQPDGGQLTGGLLAAYERVPEEARRVLGYLGALQVRDLEVGPVAAMARLDRRQARRQLDELVDAGLLERLHQVPGHYRLHGPARRFAEARSEQVRLANPRDRRAALERAFNWYAERLDFTGLDEPAEILSRMDWFDRERPNLLSALFQAWEEQFDRVTVRLAIGMGRLLNVRRQWATWLKTAKLGLLAARHLGNATAERVARQNLGDAYLRNGDFGRAVEEYDASLRLRTEADGAAGRVTVLARLAEAHLGAGEPGEAVAAYEESLRVHRTVRGDRPPGPAEAWLLQQLGTADRERGDPEAAVRCYRDSLDIYRSIGDRSGEADVRVQLAVALNRSRLTDKAIEMLERADELYAELGADGPRAEALRLAGTMHRKLGQLNKAVTAFKWARVLARTNHDPRAEATIVGALAETYRDLGAFDEAATTYRAAAYLAGSFHDRHGEARLLCDLGQVHLAGDRPEEATPVLERSLHLHRDVGDEQGQQVVEDLLRQASAAPRPPGPEPPGPAPQNRFDDDDDDEGPFPTGPPDPEPTPPSPPPNGLGRIREGIRAARDAEAAPVTAVGFGPR
jgi:tetratricopeptide (TPR) repeat protein